MRRFIFTILFIVAFSCILYAEIIDETGSFAGFVYGEEPATEYDGWITHLTKKIAREDWNVYAPFVRNGIDFPFGTYRTADELELEQWDEVCSYFIQGNYATADAKIAEYGFPYQVVRFNDTDTGRLYYMLRETLDMTLSDDQGTPETTDDVVGGWNYSWGLYVVRPDAPLPIVVNFVHPGDDYMVPPLVVKAFTDWDAKYMMMSGTSREAEWSEGVNYTNDRSDSDPSRNPDHPFNKFYVQACNEIRTSFNCLEYSVQLHSYDWGSNTHFGVSNIQLSAGPGQDFPSLPIRDHSSRKRDVVNMTDYLVYPANTIGFHDPVYVTDYYTVFYNEALAPFCFCDGVHDDVSVTNRITLPGAAGNVQFFHTNDGHGKYEVVNRFLHVEMDELPYCYPQTEFYWKWFYGFDVLTGTFDMSNRFTYSYMYYSPFIEALGVALREAIALEDDLPVDTPTNFAVLSLESTIINLGWTEVDCYDFDTYEILYALTPNSLTPYIRNKDNEFSLAAAKITTYALDYLDQGATYYIRIRAKDRNGNSSEPSEEITVYMTGLADIVYDEEDAIMSLDRSITLKWNAENQSPNLLGYKVYRSRIGGATVQVASYETSTELQRTGETQSFTYEENSPENYREYEYYIAMCDGVNEYPHSRRLAGSARPMYVLTLTKSDGTSPVSTTVGFSPFASDGLDTTPPYDIVLGTTANHQIRVFRPDIWVSNSAGNLQQARLTREIKREFDMNNGYKSFYIRFRSNLGDVRVALADINVGRQERILWEVEETLENIDLRTSAFNYTATVGEYVTFLLHIGHMQPVPIVTNAEEISNRMYTSGERIDLSFGTRFSTWLSHFVVKIANATSELVINSNVSPNETTLSYSIPANMTMHDASIIFIAHCTDGTVIEYPVVTRLGIVPPTTTISFAAYDNFVANPFPANPLVMSTLGIEGNLYNLVEGNWFDSNQMDFSTGYLLRANTDFSQAFSYDIVREPTSISVSAGWNLVPNPFMHDFSIYDLRFSIGGGIYTYNELLRNNILLPYVRVLRGGVLTDTDEVRALEAFLLFINLRQNVTISIEFTPYQQNSDFTSDYFAWQSSFGVRFQNDDTISDAVVVSVVNSTPRPNDFIYQHGPKSVTLPGGMSFYLKETTTDTEKYHNRTIGRMSEEEPLYAEIPFTLEIPSIQPLVFESSIVADEGLFYNAMIVLDGIAYNLPLIGYTPTSTTIDGLIHIENAAPTIDKVTTPINLSVYPNPFNPVTNIAFSIPNDTFVECAVYNIKGQRVKTLTSQYMKGGNHILSWNGVDTAGRAVGSGIYFVAISPQGQNRLVKKVTLLK